MSHIKNDLLNENKKVFNQLNKFYMININVFISKFGQLMEKYKSSNHPLFKHIAECNTSVIHSTEVLNELYKRYQAAMHATRVMVYFTPHLDTINLRMAKFKVIADDDGDISGDSHHYQLRRTWSYMLNGEPQMNDNEFGELDKLKTLVDPATEIFITTAQKYYPLSMGPWITIEGLAHDWIGAWQQALSIHFPSIATTDYFMHNYANRVEILHAQESFDLVTSILIQQPNLIESTLEGAEKIAKSLFVLWSGIDEFIYNL